MVKSLDKYGMETYGFFYAGVDHKDGDRLIFEVTDDQDTAFCHIAVGRRNYLEVWRFGIQYRMPEDQKACEQLTEWIDSNPDRLAECLRDAFEKYNANLSSEFLGRLARRAFIMA